MNVPVGKTHGKHTSRNLQLHRNMVPQTITQTQKYTPTHPRTHTHTHMTGDPKTDHANQYLATSTCYQWSRSSMGHPCLFTLRLDREAISPGTSSSVLLTWSPSLPCTPTPPAWKKNKKKTQGGGSGHSETQTLFCRENKTTTVMQDCKYVCGCV